MLSSRTESAGISVVSEVQVERAEPARWGTELDLSIVGRGDVRLAAGPDLRLAGGNGPAACGRHSAAGTHLRLATDARQCSRLSSPCFRLALLLPSRLLPPEVRQH